MAFTAEKGIRMQINSQSKGLYRIYLCCSSLPLEESNFSTQEEDKQIIKRGLFIEGGIRTEVGGQPHLSKICTTLKIFMYTPLEQKLEGSRQNCVKIEKIKFVDIAHRCR